MLPATDLTSHHFPDIPFFDEESAMHIPVRTRLSILAVAIATGLAACGGGGGGDTPATTNPGGGGSSATPSTPTGPTASVGTSSGTPTNTSPTAPRPDDVNTSNPPSLPTANQTLTTLPSSTYANDTVEQSAWASIQDWRGKMRSDEEGEGGVGYLTQRSGLDAVAATIAGGGATPATVAGYETFVTLSAGTNNGFGVTPGAFCSKALFANIPTVELAASGMRDGGIAYNATTNTCTLVAGLTATNLWQLPPTGSSSVYPYPGKTLALTRFIGNFSAAGFASQPGHPVYVSFASVDALPVAIAGVGSGSAIAASAITINRFGLTIRDSGVSVPSTILAPAGMAAGSGVTLTPSTAFRYPTSVALVPNQVLAASTAYRATIEATVNGRRVTRTWEFTTAEN